MELIHSKLKSVGDLDDDEREALRGELHELEQKLDSFQDKFAIAVEEVIV